MWFGLLTGCGGEPNQTAGSDGTSTAGSATTFEPATATDPTGETDGPTTSGPETATGDPTSGMPTSSTGEPTTSATGPTTDSTTNSTTDTTGPTTGDCEDPCPVAGGIPWQCQQRFLYGINYAWRNFGADFGGIEAWGQPGVSTAPTPVLDDLKDMRAHGVRVVRWWIWPDFRGDAIEVDNGGYVVGLGGTALADMQAALELAEQADVYLMPCLFSFDAFRPGQDMGGIWVPGMTGMVTDADKQQTLLDVAVRPLIEAAAQSPYSHRVLAWDVINEPEWALWGQNPYGDPPYDPIGDLQPVSHEQMEAFLAATIAVIREHSTAPVTVGAAAFKWARAWHQLDLDFDQFHMYDWVDEFWPYDQPPGSYGLDDRPVVMGEFYLTGVGGDDYATVVDSWLQTGYAGALGWQYNEASQAQLDAMAAVAEQIECQIDL